MPVKWLGIEKVQGNLNRHLAGIKNGTRRGMHKAVLLIKGRALKLTPVSLHGGHLRGGAYTDVFKRGTRITGVNGYQAAYAPSVHEMLRSPSGKPIKWTKKGTGAKFLERPWKESAGEVRKILIENGRVK